MCWVDHVARMATRKFACSGLVGITYLKASLLILRIGEQILLKCIFQMWNVETWTGLKEVSVSIN